MVYIKQVVFSELFNLNSLITQNFENKILLAEIGYSGLLLTGLLPARTSTISFFLIEKGFIEVELDYSLHSLKENSFLIILPEHLIQSIRISKDFKAKLIIIDQEYFGSMEINKNRQYQPGFMNVRRYPGSLLSKEEIEVISSCFVRMKQKILNEKHHRREAIIKILLTECILEIDNIFIDREYSSNFQPLSRQEILLQNFFQLLQVNIKYEHQVTFYSDKLNVTPQYLALVLKQLTGKTTREWIAHALLTEAKILIKHSQNSIQQISDFLNFCDASAFGKFFKNLTGKTPFKYKRDLT